MAKRPRGAGETTPGWQCGHCESFHDERYEAQACCAPEPVRAYACDASGCDKSYTDETEAEECCLPKCEGAGCSNVLHGDEDGDLCDECTPDEEDE
jgi:hypothetical protein